MMSTTAEMTAPTTTPGRRWATLAEATDYGRVSRRTIYRLAEAGRMRVYRPRGGKSLIDLDTVLALEAEVRSASA